MATIERKLLNIEVANEIREMIRVGTLEKGDKINEKELSLALGVSRTPIREALQRLSIEGLIKIVPHKGAYVSSPRLRDIREMFEVMSVLEGACARMATEKMTDDQLERLEALHEELERHYKKRDHENYLQVNHQYHTYIQELTGNKILNDIINGIRLKILLYRSQQLYRPRRFDESIKEHRELLKAFKKKDPVEAETLMKSHLMNQCEALVSLYEAKHTTEE